MPKSNKNDELIVQLLQSDKTINQGFKLLLESYDKRLYYHIFSILKNQEDAKDVTQNTFIKVFKGIKGFRANSTLYTWLYRIATNESLTHLKRKKKSSSLENIHHLKTNNHHDETDTLQKLKNAIETLPTKQQIVFNLKYFEDLTYREISEILDTSIGGLKANYHLAVKKIHTYLKEHNTF